MPAETVTTMDLIERRQAELRDATATGDARRIDRAARALERARESAARAASRARDRQEAQRRVDAEARAAEKAAKRKLADQVEAELRSARTPRAEIHMDDGRVVAINLGAAESIARQVQIEAVRRLCYQVSMHFQSRVVASRSAGEAVPPVEFIEALLGNSSGLLMAAQRSLVTVRDEEKPR